MTSKKIFGYIFIILASLLSLGILGRIISIITLIIGFFYLITGTLDSYQTGKVLGGLAFWAFYFGATFVLWRYGLKWKKNKLNSLN